MIKDKDERINEDIKSTVHFATANLRNIVVCGRIFFSVA
jgi:hypothetical protein